MADVLVCADEAGAKETTMGLVESIEGLRPLDAGRLTAISGRWPLRVPAPVAGDVLGAALGLLPRGARPVRVAVVVEDVDRGIGGCPI